MQGCAQAARAMTSLLQPVLQDRQPSAHSMQQLFEDTASIAESPEELSSMLQQAGADLFFPEELYDLLCQMCCLDGLLSALLQQAGAGFCCLNCCLNCKECVTVDRSKFAVWY